MRQILFILMSCLSLVSVEGAEPISAVVFDFGGVMANTDAAVVRQFIQSSLNLSDAELQNGLKAWKDAHTPAFWVRYAEKLGKPVPEGWQEQFQAVTAAEIRVIPGMFELVCTLKEQGIVVALLSNTTADKAAILRGLGYYDLFDPVLLSFEIRADKPSPKAYQTLLATLQLPPELVLFIDNDQGNIQAAEHFGIRAIHFTNPEKLKKQLQALGLVP